MDWTICYTWNKWIHFLYPQRDGSLTTQFSCQWEAPQTFLRLTCFHTCLYYRILYNVYSQLVLTLNIYSLIFDSIAQYGRQLVIFWVLCNT